MPYPADDADFTEITLDEVREDALNLDLIAGGEIWWSLPKFRTDGKDYPPLKAGTLVRFYGNGRRGIFIDGHEMFYRAPAS